MDRVVLCIQYQLYSIQLVFFCICTTVAHFCMSMRELGVHDVGLELGSMRTFSASCGELKCSILGYCSLNKKTVHIDFTVEMKNYWHKGSLSHFSNTSCKNIYRNAGEIYTSEQIYVQYFSSIYIILLYEITLIIKIQCTITLI